MNALQVSQGAFMHDVDFYRPDGFLPGRFLRSNVHWKLTASWMAQYLGDLCYE